MTKKKILISVFVFMLILLPFVASADGLVPCGGGVDTKGNIEEACDFNFLMNMVNNIIKFVLFKLAVPVAAIMCAYAGFKMVTAGGDSGSAREMAKNTLTNAVVGLALAAAAWLIIRTLLSVFGFNGSWIGF